METIDKEFDGYSIYLANIKKLINDIDIRLNEYDIEFFIELGKLFNTFNVDDNTKKLMVKYNEALLDSINLMKRSIKFDMLDMNGDNLLSQILKRLLYNYSYDDNGMIIIKRCKRTNNNYNNLRSIIKFMINYDNECLEKYGIPSSIHSKNTLGKFHNMVSIPGQTRMRI